jgi:6-pyruvoyl-tetrahydropterin synthase
MVQDYADIKALVGPIVDQLDHHHLGYGYYQGHELPSSVEGFNVYSPTSENILMWIADQISQAGLDWSQLDISETCTSSATLTREEYDDRY